MASDSGDTVIESKLKFIPFILFIPSHSISCQFSLLFTSQWHEPLPYFSKLSSALLHSGSLIKQSAWGFVIQSGNQWALSLIVLSYIVDCCGQKTNPQLRLHILWVLKAHCFEGKSFWSKSESRKQTQFFFTKAKATGLIPLHQHPQPTPSKFPVPISIVAFLYLLLCNFSLCKIHFPSHSLKPKRGSE